MLLRSPTIFSRIISIITRSPYSHSALQFDCTCRRMYSFSRKYQWLIYPGAFNMENVDRGVLKRCRNAPCAIYRVDVDEDTYNKMKAKVEGMFSHRDEYRYNVKGIFLYLVKKPMTREKYYFCSEFVSAMLSEAGVISHIDEPSMFKPKDFLGVKELKLCYEGGLRELREISKGAEDHVMLLQNLERYREQNASKNKG